MYRDSFQQVIASDIQLAKRKMNEIFKEQWAAAYTQKEFELLLKKKRDLLKPLPPIYLK